MSVESDDDIYICSAPLTDDNLRELAEAGYEWVRAIIYIDLEDLIEINGLEAMNEYADERLGVVLTDITYKVASVSEVEVLGERDPYDEGTVYIAVEGCVTDALEHIRG